VNELRPLVVKIGGGLLREQGLDGLRRACMEVNEIATRRPVLVVPGGGPFADTVRAVDAAVGLTDQIAHVLALRAMDQLGVLLAPLLPGAELVARLEAPRSLGLLQVARAFGERPGVPESWNVTSDSLAVLAAGAIGSDEALLLKPVDPPRAALTAGELQVLQEAGGGRVVDAYLAEAVCRTGVSVMVRAPGRRSGTHITPR
jgi:aspartokinase-like uncharacterized kinase